MSWSLLQYDEDTEVSVEVTGRVVSRYGANKTRPAGETDETETTLNSGSVQGIRREKCSQAEARRSKKGGREEG